jgi:hypothetical protein
MSVTQYPKTLSIYATDALTFTASPSYTDAVPSTGMHEAHVELLFSPVASFGKPEAQLQTTFDNGTTWLTIGSAVDLTMSALSAELNVFSILAQAPTTSVSTVGPSATVSSGFGQLTRIVYSDQGFDTDVDVSIAILFR